MGFLVVIDALYFGDILARARAIYLLRKFRQEFISMKKDYSEE